MKKTEAKKPHATVSLKAQFLQIEGKLEETMS
jgi:hypothetical protein